MQSVANNRPALSIVIPAYNEEEAIGSIIEQTLAARSTIMERGQLSAVDVIVVNDGSSDRTSAIAETYAEIQLISYAKNRGYGAAIKQGFAAANGELLSFLDADGTCDPRFFGDLCKTIQDQRADVVIGARLGPESRMPALRRLGNRIYAGIITMWGGTKVTDSASGMRVIRRESLGRLYPLPDGMHFTPAMSSLAVFDPRLTIVEIPMPYSERAGESKLSVIKDGMRFLRIIVDTALTYRPLRFFGVISALCFALAIGYGLMPLEYYASHRRIEEWMIYRLVAVGVALVSGTTLLAVGVLGQQIVSVIHDNRTPRRGAGAFIHRLLLDRALMLGSLAILAGVVLNWRPLIDYAMTGHVTSHWIYQLTGGLLVTLGVELIACGVLTRVLNILTERGRFATPLTVSR